MLARQQRVELKPRGLAGVTKWQAGHLGLPHMYLAQPWEWPKQPASSPPHTHLPFTQLSPK